MNKKRILAAITTIVVTASLFVGCGKTATDKSETKKVKIGLATDEGGLNDKSFNQASDEGIKKAEKELKNIEYKPIESKKKDEYQANLQALVDSDAELIFGVGYQMEDDVKTISEKYPDKKFAIIDSVVDAKNVVSLNFKEQEGSFLMGVIAGKTTKSNKIGFIGGKDFEVINRFAAGYIAGAKTVNKDIKVIVKYANDFANPGIGEELAKTMYNEGCDVVYHAAGGTGIGLFKAAKEMTTADKKVWAIGVDKDQAAGLPEYADVILSSMIKRVDIATFDTVKDFVNGKFEGGVNEVLGLKEEGVDIAKSSEKNVQKDVLDLVEKYRKAIIDGKIVVPSTKEEAEKFTTEAL